ncbi:MAG: transposase family protein, partial [archaeon]|nr:transposase family protein [archaeon]
MDYMLRVIVEKVDLKTKDVVSRNTVEEREIKQPKKIIELGLLHEDQINLLKKIQQLILEEQSLTISCGEQHCPNCGFKLKKNGYKQSNFHAVFSDHKLKIQRYICPKCNSNHVPSIKSLFGTSMHPDLYKLQSEMGSAFSFFKSECQLSNLCKSKREINNHQRIKRTVNAVGEEVFNININGKINATKAASSLVVQIDGRHIKDKDPNKRSFEALSAKIYKPENIVKTSKDRTEIKDKTCVASAKKDRQKSMKLLIEKGAKKQGFTSKTKVTVIADGAQNCWNSIDLLKENCSKIECILDWFHIAKEFQPLLNSLIEEEKEFIESIKWNLWNGKSEKALSKITEVMGKFEDESVKMRLKKIF